jgi:hypothetical protein
VAWRFATGRYLTDGLVVVGVVAHVATTLALLLARVGRTTGTLVLLAHLLAATAATAGRTARAEATAGRTESTTCGRTAGTVATATTAGRTTGTIAATTTAGRTTGTVAAATAAATRRTAVAAATTTGRAAVAAAAAAATGAAIATAAATTGTASFTLSSLVDAEHAAVELLTIELLKCLLGCFRCRHLYEREPAGPAGLAVHDDGHARDLATVRTESVSEARFGRVVVQVAHIELRTHGLRRLLRVLADSGLMACGLNA